MLDDISDHLLSLLCADERLFAGGTAFPAGWEGVKRPEPEDSTDTPTAGFVNVFDTAYAPDSSTHRPAIYLGLKALQASDKLEYETSSAPDDHTELRAFTVLLVICTQAKTELQAQKQRNQLRQNIKAILGGHRIETDHWYWLDFPGTSGGVSDKVWVSSSGGGEIQVAEAMGSLPVVVSYNWSANSPG